MTKNRFWAKMSYFFNVARFFKKISGNVEKLHYYGVREGVK